MPEDLVFRMGEFEARIPADLRYAKNHMWVRAESKWHRFGFTAYAVRLLQDVYFLEWSVDPGTTVAQRQEIGFIESSKAEAELYAPIAGRMLEFNPALLEDPAAINLDNYQSGWLFQMEGDADECLAPRQYIEFLEGSWEQTQRLIKGQMNE
jgi:glycine cleavage system H protein